MAGVAEEATGRMLHAAGVTMTGLDIEELPAGVTTPPPGPGPRPPRPPSAARIGLRGTGGTRQMTARIGYGLALAAAAGAPVRVADAVMDRLAVPVQGGDLLGPFLPRAPAAASHRAPRARFEPGNMTFADGLDRWEFGGSFRREADESHGEDYSCRTEGQRAILASAVPEPYGFAGLQQVIAADDYRGAVVVFRGELRTKDVADQAGLHLHVGPPLGPVGHPLPSPPKRVTVSVAGSHDWARHEVTAEVPDDAGIIRFGIFLAGRGQVELRHAELARGADPAARPGRGPDETGRG